MAFKLIERGIATTVIALSLLGTTHRARAQNKLTNPSFEAGVTGYTLGGQSNVEFGPGEGSSNGLLAAQFNGHDGPTGTTLSQSFATDPGQTYLLSFDFYAFGVSSASTGLITTVSGTGTLLSQTVSQTGSNFSIGPFTTYSFPFTANSALSTLTFEDTGATTTIDGVLDNLSVVATATPEPGSFAGLGALALSSTGFLLFRKRHRGN